MKSPRPVDRRLAVRFSLEARPGRDAARKRDRAVLALRLRLDGTGPERRERPRQPDLARQETDAALHALGVAQIAAGIDVGVEASTDPNLRSRERLERGDRDSAGAEHRVRAVPVLQIED